MRLFSARPARRVFSAFSATLLVLMAAACGDNVPLNMTSDPALAKDIGQKALHLSGQFAGAGSSAQKAAIEAWIAGYNVYQPSVDIAYDPSGSGAGVNSFLQGATLWAGSDKPLTQEQKEKSKAVCEGESAIDLPVYISPLAVIYNLPGLNDEHLIMSADVIADIFNGTITTWNDARIKELNPSLASRLPNLGITPIWRSDKSGTTNSFQEYFSQAAPQQWASQPQETWPNNIGQGAKGTAGVVSALSQAQGTIGYADAAQSGDLGTVAVNMLASDGSRQGIAPNAEKASNLVADALTKLSDSAATDDMTLELDHAKDSTLVYPITQISYSIVCPTYADPTTSQFIGSWLEFQSSEQGQKLAASNSGSAPLPREVRTRITAISKQLMEAGDE
jgi:phosphate transport system substrate-binding protein